MTYTAELSTAVAALWNQANAMKIGSVYDGFTRNQDPAVRAQFKADREIVGTHAWAVCQCMRLRNPEFCSTLSDSECAAISAALNS